MNPFPMLLPNLVIQGGNLRYCETTHATTTLEYYTPHKYLRCNSTLPSSLEPPIYKLASPHNLAQSDCSGTRYITPEDYCAPSKEGYIHRTSYEEGVLKKFTVSDTPEPWGLFFQDNATPQMEGLEELHNNIMFYLAVTLFAVSWIMVSIVLNYRKNKARISNKYVNHGTLVELIWTISPALILILIAFPSFKLLYLMDEVIDPSLVIYGGGHQWYWSYQYPDFTNYDVENTGVSLRAQYIYNP
jgi:hypothetical protein